MIGEEGGDAIDSTNPKVFTSGSNSIFPRYESGSLDAGLFVVSDNDKGTPLVFESTPLVGEERYISGYTEIESYPCRQIYDNLNLHHQIPRSDRQYSWIGASITHTGACEPRYSGFMQ
jgi:hypothetical protein